MVVCDAEDEEADVDVVCEGAEDDDEEETGGGGAPPLGETQTVRPG